MRLAVHTGQLDLRTMGAGAARHSKRDRCGGFESSLDVRVTPHFAGQVPWNQTLAKEDDVSAASHRPKRRHRS